MIHRKLVIAALFGCAAIPALALRFENGAVGQPAPAFTLTDSTGKAHSLSDFKGKYVVLEWFNKDCPFVKKHYESGNMQKVQGWAKEKGVVWLTVISSAPGKQGHLSPEQAEAVRKNDKLASAAILIDADGKVGKSYNAKVTPHIYVIDPSGKLIYNGAIDDKPTTNKADLAIARNHVKMALEESMAGKEVTVSTSQPYGCGMKY